jgi:hypothetical protein
MPLSSPAPRGIAQEAKHSDENTWSTTCGKCRDSWESGEHTRDTHSEWDQQLRPRQPGWPITKSNFWADGHQTRTKHISITTSNKSSHSPTSSKTNQNTAHKTRSTSFGGYRRSGESPGGAAATAADSAPPRRHLCVTRHLLCSFWSDFVTVLAWEWYCILENMKSTYEGKSESARWSSLTEG